jgi:hypothetical protein
VKIGLAVAAFIAVFIGLVAYSTFQGPRYRAEVCMEFEGRKACKTVKAKSETAAIRAGTEGDCADIASGVTETMKCVGSAPASVKWLQRP